MKKVVTTTEPERAYTAILDESGWIVGIATENEAGYRALNYGPYETEARAQMVAATMNKALGVSESRAILIAMSSMWPMSAAKHARRRKHWAGDEVAMEANRVAMAAKKAATT